MSSVHKPRDPVVQVADLNEAVQMVDTDFRAPVPDLICRDDGYLVFELSGEEALRFLRLLTSGEKPEPNGTAHFGPYLNGEAKWPN